MFFHSILPYWNQYLCMPVIYFVVLGKSCHHDGIHFPHLKLKIRHDDFSVTFSVQSASFLMGLYEIETYEIANILFLLTY